MLAITISGCGRLSQKNIETMDAAHDVVVGRLACEYFGQTAQTLAIRTDSDELVRLVDFDFEVSPFVPSELSCIQWLETVWTKTGLETQWKARSTLSKKEGLREARLIDKDRTKLYGSCFDSPLCRVRFPYTIGWWRFKRFFRKDNFSPFHRNHAFCKEETRKPPLEGRALSDIAVIHKKDLEELSAWDLSESELADQIVAIIRKEKEGVVFISTMVAEKSEIDKITEALAEHPLMEVYLLFDGAVSVSSYNIHDWIQNQTNQLHLVPITPRPDRPTFFHLKGAASWGAEGWITFTSSNLMDHTSGELLDVGFTAKGKAVAHALVRVFSDEIRRACTEPEYLECTLQARTSGNDPLRHELRAALADSCRSFFESGMAVRLALLPNPYFIITTEDDTVALLEAFIENARHSVLAFTDRLDSWPFLFSLAEAHKKGLKAGVYSGRKGDHPVWEVQQFQRLLHSVETIQGPEAALPHAKFVLKDGKEAFWGTGNFTKNGLSEATEFFFLTDDPALIQELKDFAAAFVDMSSFEP